MEQTTNSVTEKAFRDGMHRRKFLGILGGTASVTVVVAACTKNNSNGSPYDGSVIEADGTVNLGRGDTGILNYAYALEQLEAAFYTKVITDSAAAFTAAELSLLTDIRDHEIAHREFFKAALSTKAIPALTVNFSAINFTDRASVLGAAKTFEDLGVTAYNGAGKLIVSPDYLLLAGKIVSVEARHAAFIRDMVNYGSFAASDVVDATTGLDGKNDPSTVLAAASSFLTTKVSGSNLPTM
ncbi:MAG: ferritin-like domain-containing protein [Bacteroidota bacterium]|nr:ferritin-like domain-containing protein [Bacteroidota bacterium]